MLNNIRISAPLVVYVLILNAIPITQGDVVSPFFSPCSGSMNSFMQMGNFYAHGGTHQQVFMELLAPINPPLFPPHLLSIKNELYMMIMTGQLEVGPIVQYVMMNFRCLDAYDRMMAALLALRSTLSSGCYIRNQISQLLIHAIFHRSQVKASMGSLMAPIQMPSFLPYQSLLSMSQLMSASQFTTPTSPLLMPTPQSLLMSSPSPMMSMPTSLPYMSMPTPSSFASMPFMSMSTSFPFMSMSTLSPFMSMQAPHLNCETIMKMIKYFQYLYSQFHCQSCLSGGGFSMPFMNMNLELPQKRRSINPRGNFNKRMLVPTAATMYNFEELLTLLPKPKNDMETIKFSTVQSFMKSTEFKSYLKNVNLYAFKNREQLLNFVFRTVATRVQDVNIKEAFLYYVKSMTQIASYNYASLVELIPQPLDNEEREKFEIVLSYLTNRELYRYLKNIDVTVYSDKKLLLKAILGILATSVSDVKVKDAFTYYLNYQESLSALELFTRKEITKHFELTRIFVDTLDVDNLSADAKADFRRFFKFVSGVNQNQIKNFDAWSDVKTKGEFMKALFKFLLEQTFVPPDVKQSIVKLEPLVKMDGRGAAPP